MKTSLKDPKKLAGLQESAYMSKLKSDLMSLSELPPANATVPFVFKASVELAQKTECTLFIAGLSNDWKKHIKNEGWLKGDQAKQIWLGQCTRKGDTMELIVKKGKLTQAKFNAAIKQNAALKKLTWNVVEAIEDGEDSDLLNEDANEKPEVAPKTNTEADQAKAAAINKQLVQLLSQINAAAGDTKRQLLNNIDKLANQLYAIPNWEDYTDDKIEAHLQKIEALLAKQNQEENANDPDLQHKANAEKLSKEIVNLLNQHKAAATPADKQPILDKIQALAQELYAVPDWRDYTNDDLEKVLDKLPKKQVASPDEEEANRLSKEITSLFEVYQSAKTLLDKQRQLAAMKQLGQRLSAIPNWRDYTDDRIEKLLAQVEKATATDVPASAQEQEVIQKHTAHINTLATIEAVEEYAATVAAEANSPALRAYSQTVQEFIQHIRAVNQQINELLDTQEQIQQALKSPDLTEAEHAELSKMLEEVAQNVNLLIN